MGMILLYLLGLLLSVFGLFFIIINLNLIVSGSNLWEYIKFIFMSLECIIFFIGIGVLVWVYERR